MASLTMPKTMVCGLTPVIMTEQFGFDLFHPCQPHKPLHWVWTLGAVIVRWNIGIESLCKNSQVASLSHQIFSRLILVGFKFGKPQKTQMQNQSVQGGGGGGRGGRGGQTLWTEQFRLWCFCKDFLTLYTLSFKSLVQTEVIVPGNSLAFFLLQPQFLI